MNYVSLLSQIYQDELKIDQRAKNFIYTPHAPSLKCRLSSKPAPQGVEPPGRTGTATLRHRLPRRPFWQKKSQWNQAVWHENQFGTKIPPKKMVNLLFFGCPSLTPFFLLQGAASFRDAALHCTFSRACWPIPDERYINGLQLSGRRRCHQTCNLSQRLQPENAEPSIVTEVGMLTLVKERQFSKAAVQIVVTESGILRLVKDLQSRKA